MHYRSSLNFTWYSNRVKMIFDFEALLKGLVYRSWILALNNITFFDNSFHDQHLPQYILNISFCFIITSCSSRVSCVRHGKYRKDDSSRRSESKLPIIPWSVAAQAWHIATLSRLQKRRGPFAESVTSCYSSTAQVWKYLSFLTGYRSWVRYCCSGKDSYSCFTSLFRFRSAVEITDLCEG